MSSFGGQRDPPPNGPLTGRPADKGGDLLWRQHPAPLERAILWYPAQTASAVRSGRDFLRFITLGALQEIAGHVEKHPDQGRLGFLTGGSFSCPNSRVRYVVIDTALRNPLPIREDRTSEAIGLQWVSLQEQLQAKNRLLLGWYHTHPEGGLRLTASDIVTHSRFFTAPWQVAMLLEPGVDRPRAVVCESGDERPASTVLLPFYELLEPAVLLSEGVRPDFVRWQNYQSVSSAAQPAEASIAGSAGPRSPQVATADSRPRVLLPDPPDSRFAPSRWSLRRGPGQRTGLRRLLPLAGLGAIIMVAALWKLTSSEPPAQTPTRSPLQATVSVQVKRLDQLAEQVTEAVGSYNARAWLFAERKMTCADLAAGLVEVVDRWFAYNAQGRSKVKTLDPERSQRDENLAAEVREVELHFGASGCPTP